MARCGGSTPLRRKWREDGHVLDMAQAITSVRIVLFHRQAERLGSLGAAVTQGDEQHLVFVEVDNVIQPAVYQILADAYFVLRLWQQANEHYVKLLRLQPGNFSGA